jgi:peptidoglycan/xylan/chitin deacetylase (PgdA/CDA1 family)
LSAQKTRKPTQIISLTFDDGLCCQIERAVPVLDRHRLLATFFIAANESAVHLDYCSHPPWPKIEWSPRDIETLKSMADRGHEVGSHSVWHKDPVDPRIRPDHDRQFDPKYEAEHSKRFITDRMEREIPSFCYPFRKKGGGLKEAVAAAGYKQARAGRNGAYYQVGHSLGYFDVDCRLVGQRERQENVKSWMRYGDRWHVLMFHGIGPASDTDGWMSISQEEFAKEMKELAAYRDAGEAEVLTFANAAERMRSANRMANPGPANP